MSLVYYMVSQKAGATLNMEEAKIVEARAYRWADLFVEPAVNKQKLMAAIDVHVPSAATALLLLAGNTVLFLFLWASPAFWRRSRRDPRDDEAGRAELLAGRPE